MAAAPPFWHLSIWELQQPCCRLFSTVQNEIHKKINDLVHINTVSLIHLEVGSIKSRDPHSQKPASLPDKRASPIQHFSSFPVQNALLHSWNICSFVTRQFPQN